MKPQVGTKLHDRAYDAYDIFQSGTGFGSNHFGEVWKDIFQFAL